MDMSTKDGSIAGRGFAEGITPVKEETTNQTIDKNKITPFRPRPVLLLDVLPENGSQAANIVKQFPGGQAPSGQAGDDSQEMFETLLRNAETCVLRTQKSKTRWQLAVLMMGILMAPAGLLIGLMAYEMKIGVTQTGQLAMENQTLKSRVNSAGVQIDGLKDEIENLMKHKPVVSGDTHNTQAVPAAAALVTEDKKPVNNNHQKAEVKEQVIDTSRIETIRKGKCLIGVSREEIVTAFGEPDRTYSGRNYEQLVYFGRKPGRFWLVADRLIKITE